MYGYIYIYIYIYIHIHSYSYISFISIYIYIPYIPPKDLVGPCKVAYSVSLPESPRLMCLGILDTAGKPQLTVKAIVGGIVAGCCGSFLAVYYGLKTGVTPSLSLDAFLELQRSKIFPSQNGPQKSLTGPLVAHNGPTVGPKKPYRRSQSCPPTHWSLIRAPRVHKVPKDRELSIQGKNISN